jgi:GT2 family glycosyltransferase
MDKGQFDTQEEVFGITGALAMYRVSALQEVKQGEEYYDHDFFAYKEDVDMAWRLQSAGWGALYVPKALAYHYRGMYGPEKSGLLQKIKNRKQKSSVRNYYSTRNHWLMLVKNLRFSNLVLSFPRLAFYEGGRFLFVLFFENKGLRVIFDTWSLLPKMLKKRRDSLRIRKRTAKELRAWFV